MREEDHVVMQKIQNNIATLKAIYISSYGSVFSWTDVRRDIFIINCDMMIETNIYSSNMMVHPLAIEAGLYEGIEKIQHDMYNGYVKKYGKTMSDIVTSQLINSINRVIYDFLIHGSLAGV